MSPKAAAAFTRKTIADGLRTSVSAFWCASFPSSEWNSGFQEPYFVHLIIGGYDTHSGPYLTYMDYLGTQFEGPYLMHGYGGYFCYAILDRVYRESELENPGVFDGGGFWSGTCFFRFRFHSGRSRGSAEDVLARGKSCAFSSHDPKTPFARVSRLQVKHRFSIDLPSFQAICIDKDGMRKLDVSKV